MQFLSKRLSLVAVLTVSTALLGGQVAASTTSGSRSGASGSSYSAASASSNDRGSSGGSESRGGSSGPKGGQGSQQNDKDDDHRDDVDHDDDHGGGWGDDDGGDDWGVDQPGSDEPPGDGSDGEDGHDRTDAGWTDEGRCEYGTGGDGLDGYHSASDLYEHPENGVKGTSVSYLDNCSGGESAHHDEEGRQDGGKDCYTPAPVPLPATGVALVSALGGLGAWKRRRARRG